VLVLLLLALAAVAGVAYATYTGRIRFIRRGPVPPP
jgi:hypothetical protein